MEISKLSESSIKIKGKNASVVVDPMSKVDTEIIIATQPVDSLSLDKVSGSRLIIAGPGEYEVGGISITGKSVSGGVMYQIVEGVKMVLIQSSSISSVPDDEEFDCVIVKVVNEFKEDALGPINAKCVILYGDTKLSTITSENQENTSKVNVKKTAEIQGKTFIF